MLNLRNDDVTTSGPSRSCPCFHHGTALHVASILPQSTSMSSIVPVLDGGSVSQTASMLYFLNKLLGSKISRF